MSRLSIRIPDELHNELGAVAAATGKSESQIVREALEEYCEKHGSRPTCYDLAQAAGIIGIAQELPTDLSTADSHMADFGRE